MTRVLVLSNDVVGARMAGPGIRYWEIARVLSASGMDVTLAVLPFVAPSPEPADIPFTHFLRCQNDADVRALVGETDVIVTQGVLLSTYPFLNEADVPLALDFYIPFLLERLHLDTPATGVDYLFMHEDYRRALQQQVLAADFIFCASEKQRDYWLGALAVSGRINPYTQSEDPTFRQLIDVVPFGLPSQPPRHTRPVLKGVTSGIRADDKVLLWGGGVWNWLDAPTIIRAMARIAEQRDDVKLFFMGIKRPSPVTPKMWAADEAVELSETLGLTGKTVFFNDWVPYHERESYLREADLGISLHRDHLETRYSFRTRFLDYLWAGLPVVVTRGDVLSEVVARHGLGRVVAPGDVTGVAEAILSLVNEIGRREIYGPRFERVAAAYRWEVVAQPLVAFCAAPRIAPDKAHVRGAPAFKAGPTPWWLLPGKAWRACRLGGVRGLAGQADQYRRWLLQRRGRK